MRRSLAMVIGLVPIVACSLFSSLDDLSMPNGPTGPDATGDADASDAASLGDASQSPLDADASTTEGDGAPDSAVAISCPYARSACTYGESECCARSRDGGVGYKSYSCVAPGTCASPDVRVVCGGAADCAATGKPGTVCCIMRSSNSVMIGVACLPEAECKAGARVCDSRINECPPDQLCLPLGGYYNEINVCKNPV